MNVFRKSVLAVGIGAALATLAIPSAHAVSINWGEIEGSFDSTFSVGASWRVEERDFNGQIGKVNNPHNGLDWSGYTAFGNTKYESTQLFATNGSYSSNGDLANLAWSKGDAFSQVVKGLHELDLNYKNYGLFVRGMYFHDFAMDGSLDYTRELGINGDNNRQIDVCRDPDAADDYCSDIRLLDAYISADYDWGDVPVTFRVGQQVISWGESALISHGISSINAVDLGRLRTPGAELKEAFVPQGMAWFSASFTDSLSMELFYQYQWESIVVPVGGTYFASNDFVSDGGQFNAVQLGFNSNPDIDGDFIIHEMESLAAMVNGSGLTDPAAIAAAFGSAMLAYPTKVALKSSETDAPDDGQYGIKFSYFVDDTEFGIYHMNYHSRRPIISGQASNFTGGAIAADLMTLSANQGQIDYDTINGLNTFTKAMIVYPEDIKLYGLSFNTTIGETSVAGEIAHRVDEPVQIDDVELLFAAMPQQLANAAAANYNQANGTNLNCTDAAVIASDTNSFCLFEGISQMDAVAPGAIADGFVLIDSTQAQVNFTHLFGPTLGADNLVLFAEVGGIWLHKMPDQEELHLNGPGTARSGFSSGRDAVIARTHNGPETNPFPTDFAWGYRLVAKTEHNNAFYGVNASVKVIFSHDVEGITPDPIFLFTEGAKSVGASVDFDYQNRWSASVGYNAFWGGKGTINAMEDKDFVSFSIKYSI